ncbi:MAG TPA: DUF916 domain-containing protein [Candidatus Binatia bacterium]|jgi:hypothetical protein|nr:DUF916 domain-containing protein [Candidatus Binatia bacterium]
MKKAKDIFYGLAMAAALLLPSAFAQAVTISPPYFDYSLNPGDTVLDVVKVYNEDDRPITLYPMLVNFTYKEGDEAGTPSFYPADQDPVGTALAKWVTVDTKPITLQPKERANVQFAINVPADKVQPGGHFGAIMLSTEPPNAEAGKIGIASRIASLLFVKVSGEIREQASIAEFGFKEKKLWYNYLPVDFYARFENSGNTHLRPVGNLFITDWMGRQVASIKINESFTSVLPLSIRRYDFGWRHVNAPEGASELWKEWHNFALGKYKATLVLNYGASNQVLSEEREFSVWPWRLMSIFGAAAVIVLLFAYLLMRAYNAAVIRKYELSKAKEAKEKKE